MMGDLMHGIVRKAEPTETKKRTVMDELLIHEHHHGDHSKYVCRKSSFFFFFPVVFFPRKSCCKGIRIRLLQLLSPFFFFAKPALTFNLFHILDPYGARRYWDMVTTLLVLYLCWRIPFDVGLDWWYPPAELKAFELFADIWFGTFEPVFNTCVFTATTVTHPVSFPLSSAHPAPSPIIYRCRYIVKFSYGSHPRWTSCDGSKINCPTLF